MVLLRHIGYATDQSETAADPMLTAEYDAIVAEFFAANKLEIAKPDLPKSDSAPEIPQKKTQK